MLDLGFNEDVTTIAGHTMPKRQVLFFSATWGAEVQLLAQGLCRKGSKPVRISYGQGDCNVMETGEAAKHQAREGIVQEVVVVDCPGDDHWDRQASKKDVVLDKHLTSVLEASKEHKVLVFVSQKNKADELSGKLKKQGFDADAMHGGKSQDYRLWVLDQFRKGHLRVLVCTDVLGRGIDIPSVSHVVIHEMGDIEDYIHRIGRTARGRYGKGHALVFFEYWDGAPQLASDLIGVLGASKQTVPQALQRIADEVAKGQRSVRAQSWNNGGGSKRW
jgi:superfamily II DNA/RNA helicase